MAKLGEKFDMFDDATEPRADGGKRAEESAEASVAATEPERPARPARARQRADTPPPARAVAEVRERMDKAALKRWRHQLGAAALRVAAQRQRLREAEDEWADVVADARAEGAPERLLMAAALEADVDLPAGE